MAGEFVYPKRPKFFAHKFCRVLWKACVANEIGADTCWFLCGIAMTEDAKGYRSPVTYFNEQLFSVGGFGSVDAMARARTKAVKAGWLAYQPGGKGFAGKYFVTIPKEHADWDDNPTDEGDEDEIYLRKNAEESQKKPRRNREESAEESAKKVRKNPRTKCGTFFPIPKDTTPTPIPIHSDAPASASKERPRDLLFDAIAEVTASDPKTAASHIGLVKKELLKAEPPYTADDVREFGRRYQTLCTWGPRDGRGRPELGELQKHIGKIRAAPIEILATATIRQAQMSFKERAMLQADALLDSLTVKDPPVGMLPAFLDHRALEAHDAA